MLLRLPRRDHALDVTLDFESHIILLVMAAAVGVFLLGTCVVLWGCKLLKYIRGTLTSKFPGRLSNQAKMQISSPIKRAKTEISGTDTTPSSSTMHFQRNDQPQSRTIFLPIRKYTSAPHRNDGVYAGAKRFQSSHTVIATPQVAYQSQNPPLASSGAVSPHVVGWAQVADSVVGRHPQAQPLSTRVATQAEIELISGHVHIPWAFKADPNRTRPTAVKVVPPVMTSQHAPFGSTNVLREITNTNRGRDVWKNVPDAAAKRLVDKIKSSRRPLGRPPLSIVAADLVEPTGSDIQ